MSKKAKLSVRDEHWTTSDEIAVLRTFGLDRHIWGIQTGLDLRKRLLQKYLRAMKKYPRKWGYMNSDTVREYIQGELDILREVQA